VTPLIEVKGLSKRFRVNRRGAGLWGTLTGAVSGGTWVEAVQDVSFQVARGELVGYLGPNGAGKSTTLKMLTGLLVPTSGEVRVNGYVPWRDRQKYVATLGAVFGQRSTLWWDLPVIESLELLEHIYRVPRDRFRRNLEEFRSLLDLDAFLDTPVRSLSLGQRMRADLAAALLHDPELLFLDEPTIGLDVVAKERIRGFIRHVNSERGTTVVLTTHDLTDVQRLCERVLILDHGKLLYDGSLDDLQARFGGHRELVVDFAEEYTQVSVEGAELVSHEGVRATYRFDGNAVTASCLIARLSDRFRLQDLTLREPQIEDTIRRIYEESLLDR
jgi:ABC-2 type transport system ATP-binding protein